MDTIQQLSKLIIAIFIKFQEQTHRNSFTNNDEKIHKAFYKLKQKWPQFFKRMQFDTNGHFPFSENLSKILFTFKITGIFSWTDKKIYFNSYTYAIKDIVNKISVSETEIEKMANALEL